MLTDTKIAAIKPPASGQQEHSDHKVTGLRLRVGAGGKKTWTLRRRVGAKVINKKLGNYPGMGLAAARTAAERVLAALEVDGTTETLDRTFGAVAARWIEDKAKQKNKRWADQERQLELHVLPHWRTRKIAEIKRRDVRDLIGGIEGKVLPNRILALVRPIFRFALARDWIESSPAEGIEPPRKEAVRERTLSMDEVARVWRAAPLTGYPFGQFLRMLMLTAQRRTEVASMRWADVDLEARTWILSAGDTKAERAHLVPLSPAAIAILEEVPQIGPFVFSSDGETHIANFAKSKARLDEFLTAKGGTLAPWRLHDLRRTAATEMVRLGVPELVVSRVLNHAVQGVTGKHYALHSYAPEKRHALDAWAAEVDRAVNGSKGDNVVAIKDERREMSPEENALHMAALDALIGMSGQYGEAAVAALLRSDFDLHPMVRRHIAMALEEGRLRLVQGRRGKPVALMAAMERNFRRLAIGDFIIERTTPTYPQKAAVADACERFRISDRTAKSALKQARAWREEIAKVQQIPE